VQVQTEGGAVTQGNSRISSRHGLLIRWHRAVRFAGFRPEEIRNSESLRPVVEEQRRGFQTSSDKPQQIQHNSLPLKFVTFKIKISRKAKFCVDGAGHSIVHLAWNPSRSLGEMGGKTGEILSREYQPR
jgi:hypothetical protein